MMFFNIIFLSIFFIVWLTAPAAAGERQAAAGEDTDSLYHTAFTQKRFSYRNTPQPSPDGKKIAYVVSYPTPPEPDARIGIVANNGTPAFFVGSRIHLTEIRTRRPIESCLSSANGWRPVWSPSGDRLAFFSDRDGTPGLWIYDVETQECSRPSDKTIRAAVTVWTYDRPHWSPAGDVVYAPLVPNQSSASLQPATTGARETAGDHVKLKVFRSDGGEADIQQKNEETSRRFFLDLYNADLAAINVNTGAVRIVVNAEDTPRPAALRISPSGEWVSYRSVYEPAPGAGILMKADLAVVPAKGGDITTIMESQTASAHSANFSQINYSWRPARDEMIYVQGETVWLRDFSSNAAHARPRALIEGLGSLLAPEALFTRDGAEAVVAAKKAPHAGAQGEIIIASLASETVSRIPLPDGEKWLFADFVRAEHNIVWQPDEAYVSVKMRDINTGDVAIFRIHIKTGKSEMLWKGAAKLTAWSAPADHQSLFVAYEDYHTPQELAMFTVSFERRRTIAQIEPRLQAVRTGRIERFETAAPLFDGSLEAIGGAIILPPGARRGEALPTIVMLYPGADRARSAMETFAGGYSGNGVPYYLFTDAGYAVLLTHMKIGPKNDKPQELLRQMDDVLTPQVYRAAELGFADINRLALSGQSFGGYATVGMLSRTNLFRAGIAVNGIYDLPSLYGVLGENGSSSIIRWAEQGSGRLGTHPWADLRYYMDNSPYFQIDKIKTPIQLVVGEADPAAPPSESEKLFVGLRRLNKKAEILLYDGQPHGIMDWDTDYAIDAAKRMIEFLDAHLVEGEAVRDRGYQ